MELDLVIRILELVVPIAIALASLFYAIKQRNLVKKEISKKRYLESALSNLNEIIKLLKNIPNMLILDRDSDECSDIGILVSDILKASFELKKRKIAVEVSYYICDLGELGKPYSEKDEREIRNLGEYEPEWFTDFLVKTKNRSILIQSDTRIIDFERPYLNIIPFSVFFISIIDLMKTKEGLSRYEEVYESVSPDSVKKVDQLFGEITEEVFKAICKPKRIEVDLNKFTKTDEIAHYLVEEILNYSYIAGKFSKVSELISELSGARKELFLKIS